jgi:hypothetical protein
VTNTIATRDSRFAFVNFTSASSIFVRAGGAAFAALSFAVEAFAPRTYLDRPSQSQPCDKQCWQKKRSRYTHASHDERVELRVDPRDPPAVRNSDGGRRPALRY